MRPNILSPQSQSQSQPAPTNPYQFQDNLGLGGPSEGWNFTNTAEWLPYGIQSQLGGLASHGIGQLYGAQQGYDNARQGAITSLDPSNIESLVAQFGRQAQARAGDQGRSSAAILRSRGIMGADASSALDAQNQAADATNDYSAQANSPEAMAQRFMQMMQLQDPETVAPILKLIMSLDPSIQNRVNSNNQLHQQSAGSGLGGILGQLLGMASGGGFGNLAGMFGGGGGGGDAQSYANFFSGNNMGNWG